MKQINVKAKNDIVEFQSQFIGNQETNCENR